MVEETLREMPADNDHVMGDETSEREQLEEEEEEDGEIAEGTQPRT